MKISNYQQAYDYLKGKKSRPYAHNTRIVIDMLNLGHEVITVTYHNNPVVNFFPDGTNTYNSCGWKTLTTKERLNWFLPDGFYIYQESSVWYLSDRNTLTRHMFTDGISIKDGVVYNAGKDNGNTKETIKQIKKFVSGYVSELLAGKMEKPSAKDCWFCAMQITNGNNLGDAIHNTEHILLHFEESYYVPSMIYNAYKFNSRLSEITKDGIARLMSGESIEDWQKSFVASNVKSCLTSYLKHVLNIAQ